MPRWLPKGFIYLEFFMIFIISVCCSVLFLLLLFFFARFLFAAGCAFCECRRFLFNWMHFISFVTKRRSATLARQTGKFLNCNSGIRFSCCATANHGHAHTNPSPVHASAASASPGHLCRSLWPAFKFFFCIIYTLNAWTVCERAVSVPREGHAFDLIDHRSSAYVYVHMWSIRSKLYICISQVIITAVYLAISNSSQASSHCFCYSWHLQDYNLFR